MQRNNDWLVVALIIGALWYFGTGGKVPTPGPQPAPNGLGTLVTNAEHRATLSAFYRDFADVLGRDQTVVKTTGQFRAAHPACLTLLLQQTGYPRYAGLDQAVSDRIKAAVGLDDAPLDGTKRAALVACLTQISKELGG